MNGNIQTPSLIIEQGAVFEGSCKMLQMTATAEKNKKDRKGIDDPVETSKVQAMGADGGSSKSTEIPSVSNVVS